MVKFIYFMCGFYLFRFLESNFMFFILIFWGIFVFRELLCVNIIFFYNVNRIFIVVIDFLL